MAVFDFPSAAAMSISTEERAFFAELGERIARLRKESSITQTQLAEALHVSQQTIQAYEVGRRRIPVSALSTLARELSVSIEELLGEHSSSGRKRGPTSRLQQQVDAISQLPRTKQRFVLEMLETVLAQQHS